MNTVANAVQETLKTETTQGKPPSVDNTPQLKEIATGSLNESLLKATYELADRAYDVQWGKDGIEDTQAKLTGLQASVGEMVFAIAKLAREHCDAVANGFGLTVSAQYFKALCDAAEDHLISTHIEKHGEKIGMTKLIPMWPQYKSYISKGMEAGLDPMARNLATQTEKNPKGSLLYPTAADYRKKVTEMETRGANERDTDQPADRKEKETALSVVSSGWVQPLRAAFLVMNEQLNRLNHEHQMLFVEDVLTIAGKAKTLADQQHREASGDTRTAAQKTAQPLTTEQLAAKLAADRQDPYLDGTMSKQDVDAGTKAALQTAVGTSAKGPQTPVTAEEPPKGARKAKRA